MKSQRAQVRSIVISIAASLLAGILIPASSTASDTGKARRLVIERVILRTAIPERLDLNITTDAFYSHYYPKVQAKVLSRTVNPIAVEGSVECSNSLDLGVEEGFEAEVTVSRNFRHVLRAGAGVFLPVPKLRSSEARCSYSVSAHAEGLRRKASVHRLTLEIAVWTKSPDGVLTYWGRESTISTTTRGQSALSSFPAGGRRSRPVDLFDEAHRGEAVSRPAYSSRANASSNRSTSPSVL